MSQKTNVQQTATILSTASQVGCVIGLVAVIIIAISFGIGWWIDNLLGNERKIVTILMMLGSFPVSLYAMVQISLRMVARINAQTEALKDQTNAPHEENNDV